MGKAATVQALKSLIMRHSPKGIYLCETKTTSYRLEKMKRKLGFDRMHVVEADGWKGGIALLWNGNAGWEIFYSSKWILGILVTSDKGEEWNLWACYCPAEKGKREDLWKTLSSLINNGDQNWACISYFNEVCAQSEKMGGREVNAKNNFFLQNFLDEVNGIDIGYSGNTFMWCNRRGGLANIRERIDRVMVSVNWRIMFTNVGVVHFKCFSIGSHLDHVKPVFGPP